MRRVWSLPGGISPPPHKQQSLRGPIAPAYIPPELILPLTQSTGFAAEPLVNIGDTVLAGELIARGGNRLSAALHAPSSGRIKTIAPRPAPDPSGMLAPCIVIETDQQDRWIERATLGDGERLDPAALLQRLREAGIVGLGGGGFPTADKIASSIDQGIHTLVINGAECEPFITADEVLMRERASEIAAGAHIVEQLLGVTQTLVGIEDNKPEAAAAMRSAAAGKMEVVSFPSRYPSGGERQLIQILTGKEVPSGKRPTDLGIVCFNVGTLYAVFKAVSHGEPLISRVVTVTGGSLDRPQNLEVRIGTPIRHLLEITGYRADRGTRLLLGGPLMGFHVESTEIPVTKTSHCVLAPSTEELPPSRRARSCIRCGLCAEACPVALLPQQLFWYAQSQNHQQLDKHHLFDCIECGACAWVCPSHIPLVQYYRASKAAIRAARAAHRQAEHSLRRFEARRLRIEREQCEREARRRTRLGRRVNGDDGDTKSKAGRKAFIDAAVTRARYKRRAQGDGES